MPKTLDYNYVYDYFKQRNCELLSKEYLNSKKHLQYICKCGTKSFITFNHFRNGKKCMVCNKREKHTVENIFEYFEQKNCKLLSKEYLNSKTKLNYICSCGNEASINFSNFKRGHRCMKCGNNEKHTFEYVSEYFKQQNCKLLSKEYLNNYTKMEYICSCGNKSSVRFSNFQRGNRCMKCSRTEKYTFEYIFEYFKQQGCVLLSKNYLNTRIKMDYICTCGNKSSIRFNSFKSGQRCMMCRDVKIKYICCKECHLKLKCM
jgi:hypothetical protein